MSSDENDALWDPRPRLPHEEEHVDGAPDEDIEREAEPPVEPTEMEAGDAADEPVEGSEARSVLVELAGGTGMSPASAQTVARDLESLGFELDESDPPVPMGGGQEPMTFVVRGVVHDERTVEALEHDSRVVKVWGDTPIAPFGVP
jgi:hypothetical protein